MYIRWGKRLLDILFALLGLILLAPLLMFLVGLVRLRLGAPALFRQTRVGLRGRLFVLVKLRTMTNVQGPDGRSLPDAERLTSFGRFLRRTSLDELPELWNVLKGEMSLMGPRPLLVEYLPRYSAEQARRHELRPGITGWAQVNGRNALSWSDRFRLDVWYVDHVSFGLDAMILLQTIGKVFTGDGIAADSHASMPEFTGKKD